MHPYYLHETLDYIQNFLFSKENTAIKDIMERFSELCTIWTETVKFALDDLKEVRNHFEVCFTFTDFLENTNSFEILRFLQH